jgi:hypothetical protein
LIDRRIIVGQQADEGRPLILGEGNRRGSGFDGLHIPLQDKVTLAEIRGNFNAEVRCV